MSSHGPDGESFEETLRSIAGALGRYVQLSVETVDLDQVAELIGVDPVLARDWIESTGSWMRANTEKVGEQLARQLPGSARGGARSDPLDGAAPHPLDVPTEEQGLALSALDSGRWKVEPGTDALAARGDGPGPTDALGIVRELRVRDWIALDGGLTLAGRHALSRWLESAE